MITIATKPIERCRYCRKEIPAGQEVVDHYNVCISIFAAFGPAKKAKSPDVPKYCTRCHKDKRAGADGYCWRCRTVVANATTRSVKLSQVIKV